MVRHYRPKRSKTWTEQDLAEAVQAVRQGATYRETCIKYNVPQSTLTRKVRAEKQGTTYKRHGHSTVFTEAQEEVLVRKLHLIERGGLRLSPRDIRKVAFAFATKLGIRHPFSQQNGEAGHDWLCGFLNRHPEVLTSNDVAGTTRNVFGRYFSDGKPPPCVDGFGSVSPR